MIDRPYTDVAVRIVVEALATTAFAQTLEDDAHAVLAALAAEGLLVTPRIEQDARDNGWCCTHETSHGEESSEEDEDS